MKRVTVIFICFLWLSTPTVYSQQNCSIIELKKLKSELLDSLTVLKNNLAQTNKTLIQSENLTQKLNDASNTISYLDSVIDSFSNYLAGLGIFIAILALIIPFATYQYAVKPSREALKVLEKNFDTRLEQYLWENRNNQINKALENIKGGNAEEKSQAISYLSFAQSEGLTDNQLFQVYNILKRNPSDYSIKSQLAYILSTKRTDYAAELFNNSDVKDDPVIKQMAIIYYAKTGYKSNYEGIAHIIGDHKSQEINFNIFITNLNQYNSTDINEVINDKKIIDLLTTDTLTKLKNIYPNYFKSFNTEIKYSESYLSEKIKTNT